MKIRVKTLKLSGKELSPSCLSLDRFSIKTGKCFVFPNFIQQPDPSEMLPAHPKFNILLLSNCGSYMVRNVSATSKKQTATRTKNLCHIIQFSVHLRSSRRLVSSCSETAAQCGDSCDYTTQKQIWLKLTAGTESPFRISTSYHFFFFFPTNLIPSDNKHHKCV